MQDRLRNMSNTPPAEDCEAPSSLSTPCDTSTGNGLQVALEASILCPILLNMPVAHELML